MMDPIFIITGLCTVLAAIGGLILTCHLERRALAARRGRTDKDLKPRSPDGRSIAT